MKFQSRTRWVWLLALVLGLALSAPQVFAQSSTLAESGLVGTLEGPTIVRDPAMWPKTFNEAPELAEMVKAGKLPPVEQRLPAEPLVIKPLDSIGTYGGTWRRGFIGPSDGENGNRLNASDKLLFYDHTGARAMPSVAKDWNVSEDGKTFTIYLRKGMRWSDGAPFTADDFVFWYEDLYLNREIVPTPIPEMEVGGKQGRLVKVDETTVQFKFDAPYFLFEDIMAGDTLLGGGQSVRQARGLSYGAYAPAHYLKQFLPKYAGEAKVNAMAKAEGYENWVQLLHFKKDWQLNPDVPRVGPWVTVTPINTPTWTMKRNPYYMAVDTEGNQLPYIGEVVMTLAEDLEVLNLRAITGQYDLQARHIDLGKLPVLLENQEKSGYTVHLDQGSNGSDTVLQVNQSFQGDAEVGKWLRNADFRRALSMGIDRDQLNETFWLGVGVPGSVVPAETSPMNPGPEWRNKWSTHDPAQANALLDKIGLTKKDSEGFRLRTDNGQRLRIEIIAVVAFLPWPQQSEMIAQQWRDIGIQADVKQLERGLAFGQALRNEHQIMVWTNNGTSQLYLFPTHAIPVDPSNGSFMGPAYAKWFASGGEQGIKPDDPNILRIFELFASASQQTADGRNKTAQEIWKIVVDQQYGIGTVGQSPAFMGVRIANNKLRNIPDRQCIAQHCRTPGGAHPETWYYVK